jgi:hypothetical protein
MLSVERFSNSHRPDITIGGIKSVCIKKDGILKDWPLARNSRAKG